MKMKWTKEKPKSEGRYWLKQKDSFDDRGYSIRVEYVRWYDKKLCIMNWPIPDNMEWAGPMPEPEMVEGE